ncbi:MAG: hypothetical protein IPN25_07955 [Sphingobacteriales bacterium]|nr:hypothetical protein [Sphingobacteriales bacterium]MBK8678609.1 hypothetical protein [Sphingobacteriales bacterium]
MKIAIIEDKTNRLEKCTNFELAAYQSVKIITGGGFDHFLNSLEQRDTNSLAEFDCIAAHRSAMSNEIRDTVKDYCKTNNKPLVFFSGGITASVLKDNEFPFLLINSKDFYSKNRSNGQKLGYFLDAWFKWTFLMLFFYSLFYIILEYFISLHVCKNGNKLCWGATCQG